MNLTQAVREAGVVGAGGAGFPTHVKLNASAECFIVNAAECEPLIETDKYLCRTFPEEVVAAAAAIAAHLGAKRAVIALKGKYREEIAALEGAIQKLGAKVEIFQMATFYPAGDEQTMVQQVTGRSVPERGGRTAAGAHQGVRGHRIARCGLAGQVRLNQGDSFERARASSAPCGQLDAVSRAGPAGATRVTAWLAKAARAGSRQARTARRRPRVQQFGTAEEGR